MTDLRIRTIGHAGHITLNRPKALNALTWEMCLEIESALDGWRDNADIRVILIDAEGDRAFCSGGDIAEMYATGKRGDYDYGRRFWRDEYRLNAKIFNYPKPVVTFLQGFTMGGGVGVGCHGSHRIVCETSQIAMPECSIGLVPDVGGSLILAKAPGAVGLFLGLTGDRMDAGDALFAGFADYFIPQSAWPELKAQLSRAGDPDAVAVAASAAPPARLADWQAEIDAVFAQESLGAIFAACDGADGAAAQHASKLMGRNAPLAMAVAQRINKAVRADPTIETALDHEFRYTFRCGAQGDFIEGIRAAIIDRDRSPKWAHQSWEEIDPATIEQMTAPLAENKLQWGEGS